LCLLLFGLNILDVSANFFFWVIFFRFCFLKEQCKYLAKEGNILRNKAL
jgi:hypothetical protein